jgi:hypothetical protein
MEAKISLNTDGSGYTVRNCGDKNLGTYYPYDFASRVALRENLKEAATLVAATGNQELADKILDVVHGHLDDGKYLVVRWAGNGVSVAVSGGKLGHSLLATPSDARVFALRSGAKSVWFDHFVPLDFRRQIALGVDGLPLPAAVTA